MVVLSSTERSGDNESREGKREGKVFGSASDDAPLSRVEVDGHHGRLQGSAPPHEGGVRDALDALQHGRLPTSVSPRLTYFFARFAHWQQLASSGGLAAVCGAVAADHTGWSTDGGKNWAADPKA